MVGLALERDRLHVRRAHVGRQGRRLGAVALVVVLVARLHDERVRLIGDHLGRVEAVEQHVALRRIGARRRHDRRPVVARHGLDAVEAQTVATKSLAGVQHLNVVLAAHRRVERAVERKLDRLVAIRAIDRHAQRAAFEHQRSLDARAKRTRRHDLVVVVAQQHVEGHNVAHESFVRRAALDAIVRDRAVVGIDVGRPEGGRDVVGARDGPVVLPARILEQHRGRVVDGRVLGVHGKVVVHQVVAIVEAAHTWRQALGAVGARDDLHHERVVAAEQAVAVQVARLDHEHESSLRAVHQAAVHLLAECHRHVGDSLTRKNRET